MGLLALVWVRAVVDRTRWTRLDALLLAACEVLPLACIVGDAQLGVSSLFFMSGTVNYMGGLICFLAATLPLVAMLRGKRHWAGWDVLGVLGMVFSALFHEAVGTMLVGIAIACLLHAGLRRRLGIPMRAGLVLVGVVGVVRLAAPGLWVRRSTMKQDSLGIGGNIDLMARSIDGLARYDRLFVLAAAAAVVIAAATRWKDNRAQRRLLVVFVVSVAVWVVASVHLDAHVYTASAPMYSHALADLALAGAALGFLSGTVLLSRMVEQRTALLLLPWYASWFGLVLSFGVGTLLGRPRCFGAYMMLLLLVCALAGAGRGTQRGLAAIVRVLAAAALVGVVLVGLLGLHRSWHPQHANSLVWDAVQQQIDDAQAGRTKLVRIPFRITYASATPQWVGRFLGTPARVSVLYHLPPDVKVVLYS